MGWRHDEKKARKLADSDPAGAVALLDEVIPAAEKSMLAELGHVLELMELKVELAERAGRADLAESARAALRERVDAAIAESDAVIEAGEGGAMKIGGALQQKARCLDRLGEPTEANRLRLQAADVNLAAIGDEGAKARVAATPFLVATQGAMGFETSRAFQHGFESNYRAAAEVLRDPLLADGSAIALAFCKRCGGVVEANWKKHRCLKKHKVDDIRVVLTEDAELTRAELSRQAGA